MNKEIKEIFQGHYKDFHSEVDTAALMAAIEKKRHPEKRRRWLFLLPLGLLIIVLAFLFPSLNSNSNHTSGAATITEKIQEVNHEESFHNGDQNRSASEKIAAANFTSTEKNKPKNDAEKFRNVKPVKKKPSSVRREKKMAENVALEENKFSSSINGNTARYKPSTSIRSNDIQKAKASLSDISSINRPASFSELASLPLLGRLNSEMVTNQRPVDKVMVFADDSWMKEFQILMIRPPGSLSRY